ncbi:MAG: metallophosphoesterase [Micromonosporaceae bacterium]|nr:metallophosphoesterase [Micromonosporaceae bacterium]
MTDATRWRRLLPARPVSWRRLVPSRRVTTGLLVLLVAVVGAALGLVVGSRTVVDVGPFNAELRLGPSVTGDTSVFIPPLGSLQLDTHEGPAHLTIQLGALDQARTQAMLADPGGIERATEAVADDLVAGVIRVGFGGTGAAVLGAMLLAALVFRNIRRVAWAGGLTLAIATASLGAAGATFRVDAVEEPRYEGLLVNAPALVGDVQRIADDYERYTEQLQRLVTNATELYTVASTLDQAFQPDADMTRVLHVSDLHLNPAAWPIMRTIVEQYGVDVIVDTGDITDWGTGAESELYVTSIRVMRVPYLYVRGNHDSEGVTQAAVADEPNAIVLDNDVVEVAGLTFAGIGDPRFTPDQRTGPHTEDEAAVSRQTVLGSGLELATTIRRTGEPVDVAAVHDPRAAEPLDGTVPVVLAGHTHDRRVGPIVPPAEGDEDVEPVPGETLMMVQGSTGGAGLRGLEGELPESLALSVLYFDQTRRLVAYDDITVGGHGLSEAAVQRHLIDAPPEVPAPAPTE